MDKAVMISIRPEWVKKIARGEKIIEVRKTRPKLETQFKCYIYCTNRGRPLVYGDVFRGDWDMDYVQTYGWGREEADRMWGVMNGKVIGEFICDDITWHGGSDLIVKEDRERATAESCLSRKDLLDYLGVKPGTSVYEKKCEFYCWHISDLKIYNEPKELSEFYRWWEAGDDIRPCQNGKSCEHIVYDYSEDCEACGIDFDGTDCPYLRVQRPPQSWMYVEEI